MSNIININLKKLVEDSGATLGSSGFYRCQCPMSDCKGSSLSLSIHKSFKYGRCFRCNRVFLNSGQVDIDEFIPLLSEEIERPRILSESLFQLLGDPVPKEGIDYLRSRNPYVEDWSKYQQRYSITDEYTMIITPYFKGSMLVYYQARYQYKDGTRRFKNPSLSSQFFLPNGFDFSRPTIIVEGPFDAIAIDCLNLNVNIIALGGCSLSQNDIIQMRSLGLSDTLIFLDDTQKSDKLKRDIQNNLHLYNIDIIESDGDDPEEILNKIGKDKLINTLNQKLNSLNKGLL